MNFLLPIADEYALKWIVRSQRTALPEARRRDAEQLATGDRLFLYTTRGCFRNPTRDRGRVIAAAFVEEAANSLRNPVEFGGREFTVGVSFRIERLAPRRQGVELVPLLPRLTSFPDLNSWSARMRRALVPLSEHDGELLAKQLQKAAPPYPEAIRSYER